MSGQAVPRRVLILVENLPCPFDRRVWQEATTLQQAGYVVSIICPTGHGYEERYELLDGIHIHRYPLPLEADGALGARDDHGAVRAPDVDPDLPPAPRAHVEGEDRAVLVAGLHRRAEAAVRERRRGQEDVRHRTDHER